MITNPPTQRDVAARVGVSSSTVAEVLAGRRRYRTGSTIPPETIRRVTAAVAALGYVKLSQRQRRTR